MSIRVAAGRFSQAMSAFGSGTLIAQHPDGYIRIFTVDPEIGSDGSARIRGLHGTILQGLANNDKVTIIWQPREHHGWTLIHDGEVDPASPILADDADEDAELIITYVSGMLHRPRARADGPEWTWPEG